MMASSSSSSSLRPGLSPSYTPRSRPASPALPPQPAPSSSTASSLPPPPASLPAPPINSSAYQPRSPSTSYHPRSTPNSPQLNPQIRSNNPKSSPLSAKSTPASPAFTPRLNGDRMERRGSGLKNELSKPRKSKSIKSTYILKALAQLPAPLPAGMPENGLPSPETTPPPELSISFTDWLRKRDSKSFSEDETVGLGLGLSMPKDKIPKKKRRLELDNLTPAHSNSRADTPVMDMTPNMSTWTAAQWKSASSKYAARALLLKRHGDAYQRTKTAKKEFVDKLPENKLRGQLSWTDAACLYIYAYWCDEQENAALNGHGANFYVRSDDFRKFVLGVWESHLRHSKTDEDRDMANAMIGLMHLIEAAICYHMSIKAMKRLGNRARYLEDAEPTVPVPRSASIDSTNAATAGNGAVGISPTATHHSASGSGESPGPTTKPSPATSGTSATSRSSTSGHSSSSLHELVPMIANSNQSLTRAQTYLMSSRHHLPLSLIRNRFPKTYERSINSKLSDEALPAPGDGLGSAKKLNIDVVENFAWPIELGMNAIIPHVAVFGRSLVSEYAENIGEWDIVVE